MNKPPLALQTASRTHVGSVREINEDRHLARPDLGLWVVADGMGGHDQGDFASELIVSELGRIPRPESARALLQSVDQALGRCHRALVERAAGKDDLCGSTVVALLVFEQDFAVVWAGDSRLYRPRHGRLQQVTRDHSYVEELVADGKLTPAAAKNHPLVNQITRAIGADQALALDVESDSLDEHDLFLLCSDGLSGMIDDQTIQTILAEPDLEAAADQLINSALAAGGRDNITLLLIRTNGSGDVEKTLPGV